MKIAFFLKNELIQGVDWQNIMLGNPGVGGSEYLIVLTSYMLTLSAKYDVTLIVQCKSSFPKELKIAYASNLRESIIFCDKNDISYLVFKEYPRWIKEGCFRNIPLNVGLILWCHNFLSSTTLNYYSEIPSIKSVICVGREQLDLYRDHRLFEKMDYIYNGFPVPDNPPSDILPSKERNNIVSYIGSIMPFKGFQILARAWKTILSCVPDAQLYVIGSGKVYDDNSSLGKYGIADEKFEKEFMPYLTDTKGNILPSVHFMGRMGTEKIEIIKQTKVGVPNPSGDTETFGVGALEFEIMGCEVVTRRCCGYLDTVYNKDNLYTARKARSLARIVVRALKMPQTPYNEVYQFIKDNFAIERASVEWERLFASLEQHKCKIHDLDTNIPNKMFRWKWLKIQYAKINRKLGYKLPCMIRLQENRIIKKLNYLKNQRY